MTNHLVSSCCRSSNFAKLNTKQLFDEVDTDDNGQIDFDEWVDFWKTVKGSGYTDKEIIEEVRPLKLQFIFQA